MKTKYKEVYFDVWCKRCKYEKQSESEEPCDKCLDRPLNVNSHRPVYYTKK